jgi:hypothetical protein
MAKISRRDFGKFVSAAAAGLAGGAVAISGCSGGSSEPAAKHACKGMNACKGQGGCRTGDNGCAGKNSCKGKGGCKVPAGGMNMK